MQRTPEANGPADRNCRVLAHGRSASLSSVEVTVIEGKADMVALARAFLDNPHWGCRAARALSADVARPVQYQRSAPERSCLAP